MTTEPYVFGAKGSRTATAIPLREARPSLRQGEDGKWIVSTVSGCSGLFDAEFRSVSVGSLRTASVEEFWLKAHAAGLVMEPDGSFDDKDRKIGELMSRLTGLENQVVCYKAVLSQASESYAKILRNSLET